MERLGFSQIRPGDVLVVSCYIIDKHASFADDIIAAFTDSHRAIPLYNGETVLVVEIATTHFIVIDSSGRRLSVGGWFAADFERLA